MASSDMNLDLIISATDLASKEIKSIQNELKRLTTETNGVGKTSNSVFWSLKAWWLAVGAAVTWAIVAVGKFASEAIDVSISYESAFAGVRKTVVATEEEFDQLNQTLKDMETPTTFEELAHIMELGGQLGIAQENLAWFTETMDKLAVSTNLTSEEAATLWAQFANITWMDMKNIDRWGSTIVKLGNNMATTEADIVNFSSRIAAAWHSFWMSEADIMAIASTFTSLGVEAEMGWTAVSKVLNDMKTSIATSSPKVEKYAKLLGTTTKGFKEMMKNDPTWTFVKFNQALADSGENLNSVLASLWMKDVRLNDAFGRIAWNVDLLTNALDMANEGREENIALTNEASQRFATTESQIAIAQKERSNMMAELGDKIKPLVILWENMKTAALWFFIDIITPIADFVASLNLSAETWKGMVATIQESFQSFKDWITENFWPLFDKLNQFRDEHGETVIAIWETIKANIWAVVQDLWNTISFAFNQVASIVKLVANILVDTFDYAFDQIGNIFTLFTQIFKGDWQGALDTLKTMWNTFVEWFKNIFGDIGEYISESVDNITGWIGDKIDTVMRWIDNIKSAWRSVLSLFGSETWEAVQKADHKASQIIAAKSASLSGARAEWGPVSAWSTYLVWEKWPELFVPKTSGEIVPNEDLNKGGGDINISINGTTVNNQSDIDSLVDTLIRRIKLERNFWIA